MQYLHWRMVIDETSGEGDSSCTYIGSLGFYISKIILFLSKPKTITAINVQWVLTNSTDVTVVFDNNAMKFANVNAP
jgi:hypothetical protein